MASAVAFASSGVVHLVRPQTFEPMVPRVLPAHRGLVYVSGVAELVCAAGLLHPRTRPAAGSRGSGPSAAERLPAGLNLTDDGGRLPPSSVPWMCRAPKWPTRRGSATPQWCRA